MIKVHCFVSCVCEIIKKTEGVDHRPFYFGVWDADFSVSKDFVLSYHSEHTNQDFFKTWYQLLYGIEIHEWYDKNLTKQENIHILLSLLENKPDYRNIMVMLDLYLLPERENKFNQNPFPHYVMLEKTENPDEWFMYDPDFRWEGKLPKQRILTAIRQPTVAGGYYFDGVNITHTTDDTVKAYFRQCMKRSENPLTDAVRRIVKAHVSESNDIPLAHLTHALRELPVIAIRKYAYEHGFAFFWRALKLDHDEFLEWCDIGDTLVKTYTLIQYRAMKLAQTGRLKLADEIYALLDEQDSREFSMKNKLQEVFELWCSRHEKGNPEHFQLSFWSV